MATTLNKTILKEFQATNFKSFSDGQISIQFPYEDNLTRVHVVLTPTGGLYMGGTFKFTISLPENYPESVASIHCDTKIFHPNIDFTGHICFNILSDEWNPNVRLVDYAHALLWLLYQPNLGSRLNGAVPSDEAEYAQLVKRSLLGQQVGGQSFVQMIPYGPEEPEREQLSVARLVAMFNAPRPPPPPPPGFTMRIPLTPTTPPAPAAVPAPIVTPAPVITTAPVAPPPAPMVPTTIVAPVIVVDPREAEAEAEVEAEADEGVEEREAISSLGKEETEDRRLQLTRSAERAAQRAGQNQEKRSAARKGRTRLNKRRRAYARAAKPQPSRA